MSMYENLVGKMVMIQLKDEPYTGVTGIPMLPTIDNASGSMIQTPLILGLLKEEDEVNLSVETSDPSGNPELLVQIIVPLNRVAFASHIYRKSQIVTE